MPIKKLTPGTVAAVITDEELAQWEEMHKLGNELQGIYQELNQKCELYKAKNTIWWSVCIVS